MKNKINPYKLFSHILAIFGVVMIFTVSGWGKGVDLTLTFTALPDPVAPGSQLTYTVKVANSNNNKADDVEVTIPLPLGTTYVSGCNLSGSNVICEFGSINKNVNETLSFIIEAPTSGPISATATVTTSDTDSNSPNIKTITTAVSSTPLPTCADYDDDNNNNCPGNVVLNMDGATTSKARCIYGNSPNNDNRDENYHFTVQAFGTLDVSADTESDSAFYFAVGSGCGTYDYYDQTDSSIKNHTAPTIDLIPGDTVYFYVKESGSSGDDYRIDFDFQVSTVFHASDDSFNTGTNQSVAMDVLRNDNPGTNGPLDTTSLAIISGPSNGTVSIAGGIITYTPTLDYDGPDILTYTIADSAGNVSNVATVHIEVGTIYTKGDRPFAISNPEETRNLTGNYVIGGNMNLCEDDGTGQCRNDNSNSNGNDDIYIDIDGDPSTKNSTSFELDLPADSEVIWAGLYWQGVVHRSRSEDGGDDFMGGTVPSNAPLLGGATNQIDLTDNTYGADIVKLKLPNAGYVNVTADKLDYSKLGYGGFADVTSLVNLNDPNGVYMLADIKCHTGAEPNHGNYGGWALVVVYTNPHEEFRNVTIFDGFATVDSSYNQDLVIDGFLTPKIAPINSKLAFFTMDGEGGSGGTLNVISDSLGGTFVSNATNPWDRVFNSTITGVNNRQPPFPSLRLDLDVFEMANILAPLETRATLQPRSDGDRYTASFFIMSSELIKPKLCYDYAYQQNGRYITEENDGTQDPKIFGSLFSTSPVTVSVFIRNEEDSDFLITNLTTSIRNIDTTQATYIDGTTEATFFGSTSRQPVTPESSGPSFIEDVPIGNLGGEESFYLYYDLNPVTYDLNMPLDVYLNYDATFTLPNGSTIDLPPYVDQKVTSDIPLCVDGNFSYAPVQGTFNVEQTAAGVGNYNIFTQVARRIENFEVAAYDATNTDIPINSSAIVSIEVIDAGAYHETQTSCQEPDSALTPRVWVVFDNNVSRIDFNQAVIDTAIANGSVSDQIVGQATPIDEAEDFFGEIRRNSAFRISYNTFGDTTPAQLELSPECNNNQVAPCYIWKDKSFTDIGKLDVGKGSGICAQDMANGQDTIPQWCGNNGTKGLDTPHLAECLECLYGTSVQFICSRDNFAIRPEAFKVSLSDDNTTTVVPDFANNTNKPGTSSAPINLVAGYPYRFDINATSNTDENPIKGYVQSFDESDPRKRAYMQWSPQLITSVQADTYCNAPEDRNMSFYLIDGTNTNPNPLNTWEDRHDTLENVGEYEFKVVDEEWTKHDWEENLTQHHTGDHFIAYTTPDCIQNDNSVGALGNRVGCETNSIHDTTYKALHIQSHPYEFDLGGINPAIGPYTRASGQTFIYIDTPSTIGANNSNMSYNLNGTFSAVGKGDIILSNFVTGCYSDDLNMDLNYTYNSPTPTQAPYLWYSIKDTDTINNVIIRPAAGSGLYVPTEPTSNMIPIVTTQGAEFFAKDMNGSITMDLGYNFNRTYNQPLNPRYVEFHDFNITYQTNPGNVHANGENDFQIFGDRTLNQDVTFVYGRAKPSQDFYDDVTTSSIATPISIVVYCDQDPITCSAVYNIETLLSKTEEFDWYLSRGHVMTPDNDGNITLVADNGAAVTSPVVINNSGGVDPNVVVSDNGVTTRPLEVNIDFGTATNRWLIYNEDADAIPSPFYRVRFIGISDWAGEGDTGHVVESDSSIQQNRRLGW